MKAVYPTIFTKEKDGTYLIEVPDMEILTEGKNLQDAIAMARDAIGIKGVCMEDNSEVLPTASSIDEIDISKGTFAEDGESFVSMVDIDFIAYRRKLDDKSVRRNVTLPNWLNQKAEEAGLNVSGVLRKALMKELQIERPDHENV